MNSQFQKAVQLHQAGQLQQAEIIYRNLFRMNPEVPELLHMYGLLCLHKKKEEQGLELINKAIRLAPNNPAAYSALIMYFKQANRYDESLKILDQLLAKIGEKAELLAEKAALLKSLNQTEDSIRCYQKALKLSPGNYIICYNLGNLYKENDQFEQAEQLFNQALELKPDFPEALNNLGICLEGQQKYELAHETYQKSLVLRPDNVNTLINAARAIKRSEKFHEALGIYQHVLSIQSNNIEAMLGAAQCLSELNFIDKALAVTTRVLEVQPDNIEAMNLQGKNLCCLGRFEEGCSNLINACEHSDEGLKRVFGNLMFYRKNNSINIDHIIDRAMDIVTNADNFDDDTKRSTLFFALARYYEEQSDYMTGFELYKRGNELKCAGYQFDESRYRDSLAKHKACFSKSILDDLSSAGCSDSTPVFVVGMPRSGTTLVEQILSSHSAVTGCGELGVIDNLKQEFSISDQPDSDQIVSSDLHQLGKTYVKYVRMLFGNAQFMVDKLPGNFWNLGLIALALPNAKIIHCRRDPLETCLSIYKQSFAGSFDYAYDLKELGEYYLIYREMMDYWSELLGKRIYHIDYESVVENTDLETKKLLEYCGLEYEVSCEKFYENERAVKTASVAQVRKPIYKSSLKISDHYGSQLDELRDVLNRLKT